MIFGGFKSTYLWSLCVRGYTLDASVESVCLDVALLHLQLQNGFHFPCSRTHNSYAYTQNNIRQNTRHFLPAREGPFKATQSNLATADITLYSKDLYCLLEWNL